MPQGMDFQSVIKQFQRAQKKANKANEQRYQELLAALTNLSERTGGTYEEVLQDLSESGEAQRQRVQANAANLLGRAEQDLTTRGLGNTTIRTNLQRAIAEDVQQQQNAIAQQVAEQKAGVKERGAARDIDVTRMLAGAIEGRSDIGPNLSQYANLLRQAAAAGDQSPLQASVSRGPSPAGVSFGSRGGSIGETAGGGFGGGAGGGTGGGTGGGAARVIGPGAGKGYDLSQTDSILDKLPGEGPAQMPDNQQVKQEALSIMQSTAGGLVPDANYNKFAKKYGKSPKAWLRDNATA